MEANLVFDSVCISMLLLATVTAASNYIFSLNRFVKKKKKFSLNSNIKSRFTFSLVSFPEQKGQNKYNNNNKSKSKQAFN